MVDCEASFFSEGFARRRELLASARPGGSITPEVLAQLELHGRRGGLRVKEHTQVARIEWQAASNAAQAAEAGCGEWRVSLHRTYAAPSGSSERDGEVMGADSVWLATGHSLDVSTLSLLASMRRDRPIPVYDGLPELTPSLRWNEATPLYVAGALAALQLGPDAFNLAGAGLCASRIISDILDSPC